MYALQNKDLIFLNKIKQNTKQNIFFYPWKKLLQFWTAPPLAIFCHFLFLFLFCQIISWVLGPSFNILI